MSHIKMSSQKQGTAFTLKLDNYHHITLCYIKGLSTNNKQNVLISELVNIWKQTLSQIFKFKSNVNAYDILRSNNPITIFKSDGTIGSSIWFESLNSYSLNDIIQKFNINIMGNNNVNSFLLKNKNISISLPHNVIKNGNRIIAHSDYKLKNQFDFNNNLKNLPKYIDLENDIILL